MVYEKMNELLEACGEEPRELGYRRLAACCGDVNDNKFQEVYECVMALDTDDCEGFEACMPDTGETGGTERPVDSSGTPSAPPDPGQGDSDEGDSDEGEDWASEGTAGQAGAGANADNEEAALGTPGGESLDAPGDDSGEQAGESLAGGDGEAEKDDGGDAEEDDGDDSGCTVAPALGSASPGSLSGVAFVLGLLFFSRVTRRCRRR